VDLKPQLTFDFLVLYLRCVSVAWLVDGATRLPHRAYRGRFVNPVIIQASEWKRRLCKKALDVLCDEQGESALSSDEGQPST
jgi:hypothetical protein